MAPGRMEGERNVCGGREVCVEGERNVWRGEEREERVEGERCMCVEEERNVWRWRGETCDQYNRLRSSQSFHGSQQLAPE